MTQPCEASLLEACRTLFGDGISLSREFLNYLQPEGAKAAFRSRAKAHHPDRFAGQSPEVRQRQTERFQELNRAYHLLRTFFAQRASIPSPPVRGARRTAPAQPAGEPAPAAGYPHPRVPKRPLEFGLFLFHRGKVSYQELIAALVWQRRQRPNLGDIAQRWGWLDERQVAAILQERGPYRRFGSRAVSLGFLNATQLQVLLRYQQSLQKKLGQYFVEQGLLQAAEVERLVRELQIHNLHTARR